MDQKLFGNEASPEEEIAARRSLEATFASKYEELSRQPSPFGQVLQSDAFELIEHLRTGDVDFATEAQGAIGRTSSCITEAAGYVSLLLISAETGDMSRDGQSVKLVYTTNSERAVDDQE